MHTRPRISPISMPAEAWLTLLALLATIVATGLFLKDLLPVDGNDLLRRLTFITIVLALVYGNVVYQICRIGQILRHDRHLREHRQSSPVVSAERAFEPLTILVPSYKEDLRTIEQTLLSAALQDYPNRRVVLLLDDPANPDLPEDAAALAAARRLPSELTAFLRPPLDHVERAVAGLHARIKRGPVEAFAERRRLLQVYREIASWFVYQAQRTEVRDHTDAHFVELTFHGHLSRIDREIARIRDHEDAMLDVDEIIRAYRWLDGLFRVEITSFERKRYVNLPHAPNKAANLNAYIGLIGRTVRERWTPDGRVLEVSTNDQAIPGGTTIANATYVATLDADSMLAPDYARRLARVIEQPGFERVAVVQTPYTAIPGALGELERIAGATTDIQYLIHQGFTAFDATFWVGANALLRKAALDDIRGEETERGYTMSRFIQDRTVIEDTESTIDLIDRGWTLHNYPERLAFSATPPDFGSLLIQRRRWANGGLLILPKLLKYAFRTRWTRKRPLELLIRAHYLISIAATSVGLLALLLLPLGQGFDNPWLPLTALPYFVLYSRDLRRIGYRRTDIFRVYAFNILLLPVNLAGVLKSLHQALTGAKIAFGRTPKVAGRTAAPAWAILAEWSLFVVCVIFTAGDLFEGNYPRAVVTAVTAIAVGYALHAFIGLRESWEDLRLGLNSAVRKSTARLPGTRAEIPQATD